MTALWIKVPRLRRAGEFALIARSHLPDRILMKPPPFEYRAPETLDEAVGLLAADPDAKPIAGGQSLMPILDFRLAAPSMLVDLRRVSRPGRDRDRRRGRPARRHGALARHRGRSRLATAHPLLPEAIAHVAHYQIRNRGTVGGSLAHADPAAEIAGHRARLRRDDRVVGAAGRARDRRGRLLHRRADDGAASRRDHHRVRLPAWPAARRWAFRGILAPPRRLRARRCRAFYDEDARAGRRNAHVGVIGVARHGRCA